MNIHRCDYMKWIRVSLYACQFICVSVYMRVSLYGIKYISLYQWILYFYHDKWYTVNIYTVSMLLLLYLVYINKLNWSCFTTTNNMSSIFVEGYSLILAETQTKQHKLWHWSISKFKINDIGLRMNIRNTCLYYS